MSAEDIPGYLLGHFSQEVSHETLSEILSLVHNERRVALLGFCDYTKHIINNFEENISRVFEIDSRFVGFGFRGIEVQHVSDMTSHADDFDDLIVCVFEHLVDYTEAVQRAGLVNKPLLWPENFDGHQAHRYDVRSQSSLYRYAPSRDRLGEPATMMPQDTITFLIELLRASLRVPGEVAEIGVWQGGSAWNMAKMMRHIDDQRPIHLFDFFDDHSRTNPEAIMCLDEIMARFKFYEGANFYRGFADQHMGKLTDRRFCFVHIDLGFISDIMEFFWSRLNEGGMMVLDNYGHVRSWPTEFDRFFDERGYSVVRVPFSYQAFVIK